MSRVRTLLAIGIIILSAVTPALAAASEPAAPKAWTILVFLNGDNNLDPFGLSDINEMEKIGSTKDVNIVVQHDREGATGTWRYFVKKDSNTNAIGSQLVQKMPEQDMGDPAVFKEFVLWGMKQYPAEKYFVVLWNHGMGWEKKNARFGTKGISYDDTSGNHLTVKQVGDVMRVAAGARGKKIELLGYDACLMQMAEVAGEVTDSVSFHVASEEVEPGDGWPYDRFIGELVKHPEWDGGQLGTALVKVYSAFYGEQDQASTLSVIDLTKLAAVSKAADAFVTALMADQGNYPAIAEAVSATQAYTEASYKDMIDFVDKVTGKVTTSAVQKAAADLKAAVAQLVVANAVSGSGLERSYGLAVWLPDYAGSLMERYRELAWAAGGQWDEFISATLASGAAVARDLVVQGTANVDLGFLVQGMTAANRAAALEVLRNNRSRAARDLYRALNAQTLHQAAQ